MPPRATPAEAPPSPVAAGPDVGPALISLRDVSRRYSGATEVAALEHASLEIRAGEFVVVLGTSGSGKTTLLNLIGALDQPSSGEIVIAGRRISGASAGDLAKYRRESVSFIFQTFNLFPALTAVENVEFGANAARRKNATRAAVEMLNRVGLGHRLTHFPHSLSGGEQQRVAIARALATGNPIVLADEPTGELDFRTGLAILELLQSQAGTGRVVIVVTHNREIARVADRVIELSSGRIVSDRRVEGERPSLADLHW
ncbi:MAG: ABC transporter ATP-binding protein [Chloroflexi bacterium]|nr:ABC transporter ATP-binding protein [Chloroflexota bacterium]